jgi:hypothetical protein
VRIHPPIGCYVPVMGKWKAYKDQLSVPRTIKLIKRLF